MTSTPEKPESTPKDTPAATGAATGGRMSRAVLRYTAMRLGIFAACFVVLAALAYAGIIPEAVGRANPLWLVMLALIVSAPLSLVLLRRQRDEMSEGIAPRVERTRRSVRQKLAASQSQEDEAA
ncbi:DUF4229 domain-containing protein [Streptomyces sp. TRM 70361]|uniref:DUF4229 domain-containing protein n=1 Tax=Streptomyces sp. TRM 70361 TaxID=3116553 RepID=UPI002E7B8FED|nr:DUF4229 domain-containing protein [Streptomyces sp. TRM 70361]MEE1940421.1 DUF4229 domain-containing protein [Streptomyces sp. TRM 70361]